MTGEAIDCPKCGRQGLQGDECIHCGVVFAKLIDRRPAPPLPPGPTPDPVPSAGFSAQRISPPTPEDPPSRWRFEPLLILLLLVGLSSLAAWQWVGARAAEIEGSLSEPMSRIPERSPPQSPASALEPSEPPPELFRRTRTESAPRPSDVPSPPVEASRWTATLAPTPAAPPALTPTAPSVPVVNPDWRWFEGAAGFGNGWERAKENKQAVLVYFYTDWCGYCRRLEANLLDNGQVQDFTKYLVKIRVNPERGSNERVLSDYYGVRGYPSLYVHSAGPGGRKKIQSMTRQSGEWRLKSPRAFVETLADAAIGG